MIKHPFSPGIRGQFFIVLGEIILNAIDIPLPIFQIAGGIVLFLFALTMIFGESKPEEEMSHIKSKDDKAVFPLAMPSLASPGAILAAILLTENSNNNLKEITSKQLKYLNNDCFYNYVEGTKGKYNYHLLNVFTKADLGFMHIKTEIYGDSLVDERLCKAIKLIDKIRMK